MPYEGPAVVYFATCHAGLFPLVKVGWTSNLPRRVIGLHRSVKSLFGADATVTYAVLLNGTIELEMEIQQRLKQARAFRARPTRRRDYEYCGWTEWFEITDEVEACLNEYRPIPLGDDSIFYAMDTLTHGLYWRANQIFNGLGA